MVTNEKRMLLAQFNLRSYLLDLLRLDFYSCRKARNFLSQHGDRVFLRLNSFVFLKEFIEQHGVDSIVSQALDLPFAIPDHQLGIDFRHLLSDEAIVTTLAFIDLLLIPIGDRFERKEGLAGVVHPFDVLFVALRGKLMAKQPGRQVDSDRRTVLLRRSNIRDVSVTDLVSHAAYVGANINIVTARRNICAGAMAHCDITATR